MITKSATAADSTRRTIAILGQILQYTEQIAASERNPDVDVSILSDACGRRLEELKTVLPHATLDPEQKAAVAETVKRIQAQITLCVEVLGTARAKAAVELESYAKTRRAIRAYAP